MVNGLNRKVKKTHTATKSSALTDYTPKKSCFTSLNSPEKNNLKFYVRSSVENLKAIRVLVFLKNFLHITVKVSLNSSFWGNGAIFKKHITTLIQ